MKIYIGNIGDDGFVTADDLRQLFELYGAIQECEVIKNFAFVHIDDDADIDKIINDLNGYSIKGRKLRVEKSEDKGPRRPTQKLFIGNIGRGTTSDEIRELFQRHTNVIEADVISNFGFVHIDCEVGQNKLDEILRRLNGHKLNGNHLRVQLSTSTPSSRDNHHRHRSDHSSWNDSHRGGGTRVGGMGIRSQSSTDYREAASGMGYRADPYPTASYMRERSFAGGDDYGRDAFYDRGGFFRGSGERTLPPVGFGGGDKAAMYDHRRGGPPPAFYGANQVLREVVGGPIRTHDPYLTNHGDLYHGPTGGFQGNPYGPPMATLPGSQLAYYNGGVAPPSSHMDMYGCSHRSPNRGSLLNGQYHAAIMPRTGIPPSYGGSHPASTFYPDGGAAEHALNMYGMF